MNELSRYGKDDHSEVYQGKPRGSWKPELSGWVRFLGRLMPWLLKNKDLGDRYLEAKVHGEEAQAFKTYTEGLVNLANVKKILSETHIMEGEKISAMGKVDFSEEEINEKIAEIEGKIKMLSILYDTKITASITHEKRD